MGRHRGAGRRRAAGAAEAAAGGAPLRAPQVPLAPPPPSVAEALAKQQREISISEFFERNKHILGFDSPTKALVTAVKEGVDNSLDACLDGGIPPDLLVEIRRVDGNELRVIVEDNGPGIVKKEVPNVFGRLLYGSRFHVERQSAGQQGLGISGAILYAQLTSGRPALIRSKVAEKDIAYEVELSIDSKRNLPLVHREDFVPWPGKEHGVRVELQLKGRYVTGKQSVVEYLRGVALANPHARIAFLPPDGKPMVWERATEELPRRPREIRPHPKGLEVGTLLALARASPHGRLVPFLVEEFSRVSERTAREIVERAGLPLSRRPRELTLDEAKSLIAAIGATKLLGPPTDCLSPIGERLIRKALRNVLGGRRPEFYAPPVTREPAVYGGHPFQVEVGIVYGGDLPPDEPVELLRFANRVPLLYAAGSCAITQAVAAVDWRRYGLEQRGGKGIPYGPAALLVHVCSTKVPFTSEAKEAIAPVPEILEELELALKEAGRRLRGHMVKKERRAKAREKFEIVQRILPRMAEKSARLLGRSRVPDLRRTITKIMDVVWIDERVEYREGLHRVVLDVYNYTPRTQGFDLHAVVPREALVEASVEPPPAEVKPDGKITWQLRRIPSTEKVTIAFDLRGLERGDHEETELYVSGINPLHVIGAEPLPGDWDIDWTEARGEEAAGEEVDYDAAGEVLGDD